jgi:hypothetical protein
MDRFLVIVVNQIATVFIVSALKYKAKILDDLDTNISKLGDINNELTYIINDYDALSRRQIKKLIEQCQFDIRSLLSRGKAWLELSERIREAREIMDK